MDIMEPNDFFIKDDRYYVRIADEDVELCENDYQAILHVVWEEEYSIRKFYTVNKMVLDNNWQKSQDDDTLVSVKYEYISAKQKKTPEDIYLEAEEMEERLSGFSDQDRQILSHYHKGYRQNEIARVLGISQQHVSRRQKAIKQILKLSCDIK